MNPNYYQLLDTSPEGLERYVDEMISSVLADLAAGDCILIDKTDRNWRISPTILGKIASYYYLNYGTAAMFKRSLLSRNYSSQSDDMRIADLVKLICDASEFNEIPVRHNEELLNAQLAESLPWPVPNESFDKPNVKAYLLIQAHFCRAKLPITDYINDTKSVLDQVPRVLNALVDIAADEGQLVTCLTIMHISQMVSQAMAYNCDKKTLLQVGITNTSHPAIQKHRVSSVRQFIDMKVSQIQKFVNDYCGSNVREVKEIFDRIQSLPRFAVSHEISVIDASENSFEFKIKVSRSRGNDEIVHGSRTKKSKPGSWWLVLSQGDELLALHRIGCIGSYLSTSLHFETSTRENLIFQMVSDSLMSLDYSETINFVD